jgi:uncharacterized protein YihD (DUF1040 family)
MEPMSDNEVEVWKDRAAINGKLAMELQDRLDSQKREWCNTINVITLQLKDRDAEIARLKEELQPEPIPELIEELQRIWGKNEPVSRELVIKLSRTFLSYQDAIAELNNAIIDREYKIKVLESDSTIPDLQAELVMRIQKLELAEKQLKDRDAEIARLRRAIERGPHSEYCDYSNGCTCYKAALEGTTSNQGGG